MIKRIAYTVCFSLLCTCFSFGQSTSVNASIDRDKILIGEPIHLIIEASVPLNAEASWFVTDSIPHFEFIEKGNVDSSADEQFRYYKQDLKITSFDSGRWAIPRLAMEINGRSYLTDSLPVSVSFSPFDPSQDYHDIKDILDVENPNLEYINWVLAALTLLSLAAVIYFVRKSKLVRDAAIPAVVTTDAYQEAMRMLEELNSQHLPEKGEVKAYYTRLNDIVRHFISRKTGQPTMEKTNDELLIQVRKLGLRHDDTLPLAQTLRMSDAVKFAKYIPAVADNQQSFLQVKTSVELLNNIKTSAL